MKLEDLGYNARTHAHNAVMTRLENAFLSALWPEHVGRANIISAVALAVGFAANTGEHIADDEKKIEEWKRDVRYLHNHFLREHRKVPIFSAAGSGGGYWIAESEEEADAFYMAFRARGMTGLVKAARGKESVLVEMMEQVSFEFEDLVDETGLQSPSPARAKRPSGGGVPLAMVDRFLEKMLSDPARYTNDLKKISEKFGSVLFSKVQARAIKEKVAELNKLLGSVEL